MNFAQLAPGVRVSDKELDKSISSAGLEAPQTNVFIDGGSLKNNILDGGIVGQYSNYGKPSVLIGPTCSLQLGLRYGF